MYGYTTYRGIGDFIQNNQDILIKMLKIYSKKLPPYFSQESELGLQLKRWENKKSSEIKQVQEQVFTIVSYALNCRRI
jgi:hypothetical protein